MSASSSNPNTPSRYPYFQAYPMEPVAHLVEEPPFSADGRQYETRGYLNRKKRTGTTASTVPSSRLTESDVLPGCPYSTEVKQNTSRRHSLKREALYRASCFLDSQNEPPLQFRTWMLRLLAAIEAKSRQPLHAVEDQSQVHKINILSEDLFEMYMMKMRSSQNELRKEIEKPSAGPHKERKSLKRQIRFSLDRSVGQNKRKNRPICHGVTSNRLTYQRAFRALPLVIKCVPEPLKRKLIAKTKEKAFKMAATLLERWCL